MQRLEQVISLLLQCLLLVEWMHLLLLVEKLQCGWKPNWCPAECVGEVDMFAAVFQGISWNAFLPELCELQPPACVCSRLELMLRVWCDWPSCRGKQLRYGNVLGNKGHSADGVSFQTMCIPPKDAPSRLPLPCCSLHHILLAVPAIIPFRMRWVEMSGQEIAPTSQTQWPCPHPLSDNET